MFSAWIAVNAAALAAIGVLESRQLGEEFGVDPAVIRQYDARRTELPDAAFTHSLSFCYRYRPPPFWAGRHETPLLVFLHGAGERGFDNVQQLRSAPSALCTELPDHPCAVLVPQCPHEVSWSSPVYLEQKVFDAVLQMIDEVLKDERIDPSRVYLAGFSMGGFGAWELAAAAPERFAAVVPIAGGGDPALAERLANVPLWAVHAVDDEAVSVEGTRRLVTAIREAGGQPHYSELAVGGHHCWDSVFRQDSEVLQWMFRQERRGHAQHVR